MKPISAYRKLKGQAACERLYFTFVISLNHAKAVVSEFSLDIV